MTLKNFILRPDLTTPDWIKMLEGFPQGILAELTLTKVDKFYLNLLRTS